MEYTILRLLDDRLTLIYIETPYNGKFAYYI